MQPAAMKRASVRRLSISQRIRIFFKQRRLNYLRSEVAIEWEEMQRTKARIVALDTQIIRAANDLSALKLK